MTTDLNDRKTYKESRNNIARQLLKIKDNEERRALYKLMQTGGVEGEYNEYITSYTKHKEEQKQLKKDKERIIELAKKEKSRNDNECFAEFYDAFFKFEDERNVDKKNKPEALYKSIYEDGDPIIDKMQIPLDIWKEKLIGKSLVDLGCGGPQSTSHMYKLALRSGVKEYIGVDKYPETDGNDTYGGGYKNASEKNFEYLRNLEGKTENFPTARIIKSDMLEFLGRRTAPSNFVMNGIDHSILENNSYIAELMKNIDRLTMPGNIVFGWNNDFLHGLKEYGFKKVFGDDDHMGLKIREKVSPAKTTE